MAASIKVLRTSSLLNNILIFLPHREVLLSTACVCQDWKLSSYAAVQDVRYYLMNLKRVLSLIKAETYPNIRKLTLGWSAIRQEILPCSFDDDQKHVILFLEWLVQDAGHLQHLVELGVECITDKPDLAVSVLLIPQVQCICNMLALCEVSSTLLETQPVEACADKGLCRCSYCIYTIVSLLIP